MAEKAVRKIYEDMFNSLDGKIVIGVKRECFVEYMQAPESLNSLKTIKQIMTLERYKEKGIPEICYVGQIKVNKDYSTNTLMLPSVEEVDMTNVKLEKALKLSDEANKLLDKEGEDILKDKEFLNWLKKQ